MAKIKEGKTNFLTDFLREKYAVIFLAIVLVVAVNFVTFNYLLVGRDRAQAFTSSFGLNLFSFPAGFTGTTVQAGTNMQLLADFWLPNSWVNNSLTCSFKLGTPCFLMVDANGAATVLAGADDDGAIGSPFNLVPFHGDYSEIFFTWPQWVCADDCDNPTEVYYDDTATFLGGLPISGDCLPGNTPGASDVIVLDADGGGLTAPTFTNVGVGGGLCGWIHSELVNTNGLWDYCNPVLNPGCGTAETETAWNPNLNADTVLVEGSAWTNPILGQWQGDAFTAWVGNETYYDSDSDGNFGGLGGWAQGGSGDEPVFIDGDNDGLYGNNGDWIYEADGTGTLNIGADDDNLANGTPLINIALSDGLCFNGFGVGIGEDIMYVDGNGDCTPGNGGADNIVKDLPGLGLAGGLFGTWPYTFFPAIMLTYYDADSSGSWTWGNGSAATETLYYGMQGISRWSVNIEGAPGGMIDADGTGSMGPGVNDDAVSRNSVLKILSSWDNVCFSISPVPGVGVEDVYKDTTGDCIPTNDVNCTPGGGGCTVHTNQIIDFSGDGLLPATSYGGTWANAAGTASYSDNNGNYLWTLGTNALTSETIWLEVHGNTYTSNNSDPAIYGGAGSMVAGDILTSLGTGTGSNGFSLALVDSDNSNTLTANDTIVEDGGNVETGPVVAPIGNGVLDRQAVYLDMLMLANAGTALPGTDIKDMYICSPGNDLWCGTGDPGEGCSAPLPYQTGEAAWFDPAMFPAMTTFLGEKICIFADISPLATSGRTIEVQIPQLVDTGVTPGLFDAGVGERGIFSFSSNDGPTDAAVTVPYTFTIINAPITGGSGSTDITPPSNITNFKVTANANGTVVITWTDPADSDLSQIIITEVFGDQITTEYVNAGIQTLVLTNRQPGKTYTYKLSANDASGNTNQEISLTITIPIQGEITEEYVYVIEPIPSPLEPPSFILPADIKVGDLLKNPTATTVYIVGNQGKRHVFPNEATFFTWFKDFSLIKTVSDDVLSQLPLNSNVTVRPGTKLVKIQTDPNVYAVEPGSILRAIKSESLARDLYGQLWADRILDVPDVFFVNYTKGPDLILSDYPTASLIKYQNLTDIYYIDNLLKKLVSPEVFVNNLFRDEFVIKNVSVAKTYADSSNLSSSSIVDQMMLK